jgi:hypothetical protein
VRIVAAVRVTQRVHCSLDSEGGLKYCSGRSPVRR